jgi:hypothetical protein
MARAAVAAILLGMTACAPQSDQITKYSSIDELAAAVSARARADGSVAGSGTVRLTVNREVLTDASTTSATVYNADGAASRIQIQTRLADGTSMETGVLIFPNAAYALLDERQRTDGRRYLLLDPRATDPLSLVNGQVASAIQTERVFCMTEVSRGEITACTPRSWTGRPSCATS